MYQSSNYYESKPINSFLKELEELRKINQLKWSSESFQTIQLLIDLLQKSTDKIAVLELELHKLKYKNQS